MREYIKYISTVYYYIIKLKKIIIIRTIVKIYKEQYFNVFFKRFTKLIKFRARMLNIRCQEDISFAIFTRSTCLSSSSS